MPRATALGVAICACALAAAASASDAQRTAPRPRTISVVHSFIGALGQSDDKVAWLQGRNRCSRGAVAKVYDLKRRRAATISSGGGQCGYGLLAFDGRRIVWAVYLGGGNTATELAVKTASLDDSRTTVLARMYLDRDLFNPGRVDEPLPVAGSRAGLSYYYRCDRSEANQTCYEERSEVRRVDGIRSRTLYATERPASLAFAGEKLVTLDDAGADAQVGIRSFATGALIRSFPVRGHALHVAANETYVAVAVSRGTRVELQRYRMSDGLFVGRRTLAKGVSAPELTMDGTSIVYAGSRRIYAMNAKTGEQRVVATAAALPVGVSILNRRIVWAENVAEDRARVRAVTLPR